MTPWLMGLAACAALFGALRIYRRYVRRKVFQWSIGMLGGAPPLELKDLPGTGTRSSLRI